MPFTPLINRYKHMDNNFIPFSLPSIDDLEINEVVDCMRSGWLTTGPRVASFERLFSDYLGVKHAISVNSATAGLHLALEALGVAEGDRVLTTPFTFTATAEVVRYLGADPVFVDISHDDCCIDPNQIEDELKRSRIKVIMPVHFAGQMCKMDEIMALADKYGCKVVEDSAHALPASYNGKGVGTLSDATVFSFYATKTITTGEGGMIVTNVDQIAERARVMRLHGISTDVFGRYHGNAPRYSYEVIAPGYKYNMTDISAAIGMHQLGKADEFRKRRAAIAESYNEAFADLPVKTPSQLREKDVHSWHLYTLVLDLESLAIDRDDFIELMRMRGIGTSVHFIPLHLHPYWKNRYNFSYGDFPVSEQIFSKIVSLPIYPGLTDAQLDHVIGSVIEILRDNMR